MSSGKMQSSKASSFSDRWLICQGKQAEIPNQKNRALQDMSLSLMVWQCQGPLAVTVQQVMTAGGGVQPKAQTYKLEQQI